MPPTPPLLQPCEFDSCPIGSPATGADPSDPDVNHVNSFPFITNIYGINLAPKLLGDRLEIAVAGPNVGGTQASVSSTHSRETQLKSIANTGMTTQVSGTVRATTVAVKVENPGIAFSGTTGEQVGFNTNADLYVLIYVDMSTKVTSTLFTSGKQYLPSNIWLNVNFPVVNNCPQDGDYKFALSRINGAIARGRDVETCRSKSLPKEANVVKETGCYGGNGSAKRTQSSILERMCRPWYMRS